MAITETGGTPSTEVEETGKSGEIVKVNPLAEQFQNLGFNPEMEKKVREVSHLSPFKKVLITTTLTKFYNKFLWDNKGNQPSSVNFVRFAEIVKNMQNTEAEKKELEYLYRKKDKAFSSQSDDLIALFDFVLPKELSEYDVEQRVYALVEAVNKSFDKQFGGNSKLTLASIKVGDLSMLCPLDSVKLGVNPRDSLKKIVKDNNTNVINYAFETLFGLIKA